MFIDACSPEAIDVTGGSGSVSLSLSVWCCQSMHFSTACTHLIYRPKYVWMLCVVLQAYGIQFNSLLCLNNMPIKRFADWLIRNGKLSEYMALLVCAGVCVAEAGGGCSGGGGGGGGNPQGGHPQGRG